MDPSTADEWELCNDDGFIHKRKKRRLDDPPPVQGPDPEAEERQRRERRRKVLLKLKEQYQKEIDQWEFLSNTLRVMQEKSHQQQQQRPLDLEETAALLGSASKMVQEDEIGCGSLVNHLLLQAEAQEAIIHDISSLCDVAEAMCSAQEEQLKQSFIDLPVWSSPRELMASLCDEYTYRIGHLLHNGSYVWSKIYSFRASPYPGQDSLQRVVIFGDMGKAERDGSNEYSNYQPGSLNTTYQLIRDLSNIDIVFHIGDITFANGYISQWDHFTAQVEMCWLVSMAVVKQPLWHLDVLPLVYNLCSSRCLTMKTHQDTNRFIQKINLQIAIWCSHLMSGFQFQAQQSQ